MNIDIVTNQNCSHEKFKNIELLENLLPFGPELLIFGFLFHNRLKYIETRFCELFYLSLKFLLWRWKNHLIWRYFEDGAEENIRTWKGKCNSNLKEIA
jgi:hypothetical protein